MILSQLRVLESLNGCLLVDKPEGLAFSTVVKSVKRRFNLVKVGHGGSLDALASGLLVLLFNDANKFVDRVMGADRAYTGTLRLGLRTNTGDVKGAPVAGVTADGGGAPSVQDAAAKIAAVLPQFKGDVFQTEPRFCSVRKEGSSEYEIADTGDHTQFLAHVYRFGVEPVAGTSDECSFSLVASKGVLVRALVDDFGSALGCGAALKSLRRERIGKLDVADAIPFQKVLETDPAEFPSLVKPIARLLA